MGKRRSRRGKKKRDDASSMKTIKTCDNGVVASLSDVTDDVVLLVMMKLGVADFLAFSRVCKSWRSLAVFNKDKFIVSRPPMSISISTNDVNESKCYLEDFEGRKLKTIIPRFAKRKCVGVTCGYLIMHGMENRDVWLVNPITRHELHFPHDPFAYGCYVSENFKAILVFSPLIFEWVFVVLNKFYRYNIWFSIAGTNKWCKLSTEFPIDDLIAFKRKIYILQSISPWYEVRLCEMKLFPKPEFVSLNPKSFRKLYFRVPGFASSGENLYMIDVVSEHPYTIYEIDFDEMKWVSREKEGEEYAFFLSYGINYESGRDERVAWVDTRPLYRRYAHAVNGRKCNTFHVKLWYIFHECFYIHYLHE